jgi:DHA2 family multidrug resistance protein-like MFS transporter
MSADENDSMRGVEVIDRKPAPAEDADGLPLAQRRWAILTVALAITMSVLDGAIANIALPTIARELNASPAASIWVVNAYQLAVTVLLLPLSSLGEILGFRRVYWVSGSAFSRWRR